MERNLLVAIVLSILIVVAYQIVLQKYYPQPPPSPVKTADNTTAPKPETKPAEPERKTAPIPSPVAVAPAVPASDQPATKETFVRVTGQDYSALLSSKGGKFVSFALKQYRKSSDSSELMNLFDSNGLDTSGPSLLLTPRDTTVTDSALMYSTDAPENLEIKNKEVSVVFTGALAGGVEIVKKYTFKPQGYEVGFSFSLSNTSTEKKEYLVTLPWRKYYPAQTSDNRFVWNSAEILLNGALKDYDFASVKGDEEPSGTIGWAGLGDVYFFKALVFDEKPASKVALQKLGKDGIAEFRVRYGAVDLEPGQSVTNRLAIYLGPKDRPTLTAAGNELTKALVYSYNFVLDYPSEGMVWLLRVLNNGFTVGGVKIPGAGNYGIAIILLTIIIKILFIPLTHKSSVAMKRMQDLQPKMAKIKEKYADDRAAMNKATLELFKEHKVSPLGSCWPMLLQLPVFIALYQVLSYAIELRHAPFLCIPSIYLCINDLSAPDPYYVTPILMGGTMALQQWVTPSGGDPMMKKTMMLMPIVFTWIFLNFPAGLVLYWLVQNILTIVQQVITNKMAA